MHDFGRPGGGRRVACIHQTNAADTAASIEQKHPELGSFAPLENDFSRIAGFGQLDRFLKFREGKTMSNNR